MSAELLELPDGQQVFQEIRDENKLYVDKTGFIPLLRKHGKIIFLARPRRFGKTLTVSTLAAYYSGKKKFFVGLKAEEYLNLSDFKPKPIIRLDMSKYSLENFEIFKNSLIDNLEFNAKQSKVSLRGTGANNIFSNMIIDIKETASQPIVLLIDEYDSPLIRLLQEKPAERDDKLIKSVRKFFADFYLTIKSSDEYLYFVFITGVTKFSKMSIFSTLNNLKDISLDHKFGALVGFTHDELTTNFASHIEKTAQELRLDSTSLIKKIKGYYDGFSFDGRTLLYNPYSTLLFFSQTVKDFDPFWIKSGSDILIRDKLREWNLTPDALAGKNLSKNFFEFPGEIGQTSPIGFLYQAGYLSLRRNTNSSFTVVYPNLEVRESINRLFLANLYPPNISPEDDQVSLLETLVAADVPKMIEVLRRQLSSLSFQRYSLARHNPISPLVFSPETTAGNDSDEPSSAADVKPTQEETTQKDYDESYFRDLLQISLSSVGCDVIAERQTSRGRSDLEVRFWGQVLIFELKIMRKSERAATVAQRAYKQIVEKNYAGPYENPILIGLAIDSKNKDIIAGVYEKSGLKERLNYHKHLNRSKKSTNK
jgi:hypothetical protein